MRGKKRALFCRSSARPALASTRPATPLMQARPGGLLHHSRIQEAALASLKNYKYRKGDMGFAWVHRWIANPFSRGSIPPHVSTYNLTHRLAYRLGDKLGAHVLKIWHASGSNSAYRTFVSALRRACYPTAQNVLDLTSQGVHDEMVRQTRRADEKHLLWREAANKLEAQRSELIEVRKELSRLKRAKDQTRNQ